VRATETLPVPVGNAGGHLHAQLTVEYEQCRFASSNCHVDHSRHQDPIISVHSASVSLALAFLDVGATDCQCQYELVVVPVVGKCFPALH